MSVVVAIKTLTGMVLAADRQATAGTMKLDACKVFKSKYSNTAMGAVGTARDGDILMADEDVVPYKDILDKTEIDREFVISEIVPHIINKLRTNFRLTQEDGVASMSSRFMFVTPERIFTIYGDFSVIEHVKPFAAIGCGDDKASGFLASFDDYDTLSREQAEKLATDAIRRGCEPDPYINDKVDIIFLESK